MLPEKIYTLLSKFIYFRYLASGTSMHDLHYTFRIGHTTISTVIRMSCEKLWEVLMFECFPVITTELLEEISQKFYKYANFPNCVGAIDGKHIRIIKPDNSASTYYNYKIFFPFVLMAVVDADYCFVFVDIGAPGSNADSTIFKNTTLCNALNSILSNYLIKKYYPDLLCHLSHMYS